jgi:sugar O-acyltransferase (sialic acid O-acetyltransferase NeuD family)
MPSEDIVHEPGCLDETLMSQALVILGTGGSAYDVLDIVEAINAIRPTWRVAGFLDDARPVGSVHLGIEVLGPLRDAMKFRSCQFINVIGSDSSYRRRPEIVALTGLKPEQFATLVHPGASVSGRVRLGRGVYVNHGVSVGGGAVIGDHVALSPGCIIGHDSVIEDYALVAPGAVVSGFVRLGRACYVGARSVIRQQLRIGEKALVGMGAVVVREVAPGTTVVGNPARVLEKRASVVVPVATAQLMRATEGQAPLL